jgi:hypothetical protein
VANGLIKFPAARQRGYAINEKRVHLQLSLEFLLVWIEPLV